MPYDVFLSYSRQDQAWVERLAWRLESYGLSVWLDIWRIVPGDVFVDKINQGLAESAVAIVVYSKASVTKAWVGAEAAAAFAAFQEAQRFPEGGKRLIPVKIEECAIPPLQGALDRVDFTGIDPGDGDAFESRVRGLLRAFPERFAALRKEPMGVPLVVAAMTRREVEGLFDGTAFANHGPVWRQRFDQFAQALGRSLELTGVLEPGADLQDLLRAHYGERREDWRPFGAGRSLRAVVQARLDEHNSGLNLELAKPLAPEFWSGEFFADERRLRQRTALSLSYRGCYLLLDPLALFHPGVVEILVQSQLLVNPAVTILCTSPLNARLLGAFRIVEEVFERELGLLLLRFQTLDPQCVLGAEDPLTLDLWLKTQLPLAVDRLKRAVPVKPKLQIFVDEVAVPTTGLGMLVVGEPVSR